MIGAGLLWLGLTFGLPEVQAQQAPSATAAPAAPVKPPPRKRRPRRGGRAPAKAPTPAPVVEAAPAEGLVPVPAAASAMDCGPLGEGCESLPEGALEAAPAAAPMEGLSEKEERERTEYQRLLGERAPAAGSPAIPTVALPTPDVPLWVWPVLLLGCVGLWLLRDRLSRQKQPPPAIRVAGRVSLGKEGSLVVIDVEDGRGGNRRLLLGLGAGPPQLLTDLSLIVGAAVTSSPAPERERVPGASSPAPAAPERSSSLLAVVGEDEDEAVEPAPGRSARATAAAWERALEEAESAEEEPAVTQQPLPIPAYGSPSSAPAPSAPSTPLYSLSASRSPSASSASPPLSPPISPLRPRKLPPGLEQRDDLIAEVLAERGEPDPAPRKRAAGPWGAGGA